MSLPSQYMPAHARQGFERCLFSAAFSVAGSATSLVPDNSTKNAASQAASGSGRLLLSIDYPVVNTNNDSTDSPDAARVTRTFQSAIALAEQDPLLQCVANWFKQDFDWHPVPDDTPVELDVTLKSKNSAQHIIGLSFSQRTNHLPLFPQDLSALVELQVHKRPVSICLAILSLSEDDQLRLKPGSCLVLPDTFKDQWLVDLTEAQSTTLLGQAYLDRAQNRLLYASSSVTSQTTEPGRGIDQAAKLTRVMLEQTTPIDLSRWLDTLNIAPVKDQHECEVESAASAITLEPLEGQAVVIQHHGKNGIERYRARLLRIGTGLAAVLEGSA